MSSLSADPARRPLDHESPPPTEPEASLEPGFPAPLAGASSLEESDWRRELARAIRDPDELCDLLSLPDSARPGARLAAKLFPLLVPRPFLARMKPGDIHDPLLRQVLPIAQEAEEVAGFTLDAVGDGPATRAPGLIQKYRGRALLLANAACAVHCRYCFRRHLPTDAVPSGTEAWEPALAELRCDPTIDEAILSGGDPLTLTDESLARLVHRLDAIPHLARLRIHSRVPVVIPARVTERLVRILTETRLKPVVVLHLNHPNELDDSLSVAIGRLRRAGIPLLNQAVLLAGVNDDAATLSRLSRRLFDVGVMPYYLHQLDRVTGTASFEVPESVGLALMETVHVDLPGYLTPRYVREIAGQPGKTPIVAG
jgi:EF-P beta-lysylation protein EpmB